MRIALLLPAIALMAACVPSPTPAETAAYEARQARHELRIAFENSLSRNSYYRYDELMRRVGRARELGLADDATQTDIDRVEDNIHRIDMAQELRLSPRASWGEVWDAWHDQQSERYRIEHAAYLHLPASTSWEEMDRIEGERTRVEAARRRRLPDTATWDAITDYDTEQDRIEAAARYQLPETATWTQISYHARRALAADRPRVEAELRRFRAQEVRREAERQAALIERTRNEAAQLRSDAVIRGLPATATRDEVEAYDLECLRLVAVVKLHLPHTASWGDIYDVTRAPSGA